MGFWKGKESEDRDYARFGWLPLVGERLLRLGLSGGSEDFQGKSEQERTQDVSKRREGEVLYTEHEPNLSFSLSVITGIENQPFSMPCSGHNWKKGLNKWIYVIYEIQYIQMRVRTRTDRPVQEVKALVDRVAVGPCLL